MSGLIDRPRIQILSRDNGAGLTRDIALLRQAFERLGCTVAIRCVGHYHSLESRVNRAISACHGVHSTITGKSYRAFDANFMLERVCPAFFIQAPCNVFVPNPEWVRPIWMKYLRRFDLVAAKTRHAVTIFQRLGCTTRWTGWVSNDHLEPRVRRERTFLHAAGLSSTKGTHRLLHLWKRHPEWPRLRVVWQTPDALAAPVADNIELITHRLDEAGLRRIQNRSRFHVCPSRTEGYGHYIGEALSVGAVCVTTNAAPMNEIVTPQRGLLVDARPVGRQNLSTLYDFDAAAMCAAVERCIAMPDRECDAIGARARRWFEQNRSEFPSRLGGTLQALARRRVAAVRLPSRIAVDARSVASSTGSKRKP